MKIIFMGTPQFSVEVLKGLIKNYDVVGVVTQPDKEVGRKKKIEFSPVKKIAIENNIVVFQPLKIRNDYENILALNPDMIITCAYGQIIPKAILDYPKYGCINVHASLLPKLRGGAPIHHALIDGYTKTGITIMYMDELMDHGDIIKCQEITIDSSDTVGTLHDKLSIIGRDLLLETIPLIVDSKVERIKQDENEVTFAYNIKREEEKIDFNKTTKEVYNQIRGLSPFPCSYTLLEGRIIKVYQARMGSIMVLDGTCGTVTNIYKDGIGVKTRDGEIILTEIKLEGKNQVLVKDYLNGIQSNTLLGKVLN